MYLLSQDFRRSRRANRITSVGSDLAFAVELVLRIQKGYSPYPSFENAIPQSEDTVPILSLIFSVILRPSLR